MTGAGGEASKARNAGVCLRAGWRLRLPSAGAPSASAARRLRRTCPNAERRRLTPVRTRTGLRAVCRGYPSGRRIPGGGGFATARGRPDDHLPIPRPGANPARRDAMSRRTRQTAQLVLATVRAQPVHAVKSTLFTQKLVRSAPFSPLAIILFAVSPPPFNLEPFQVGATRKDARLSALLHHASLQRSHE